MRKDLCVLTDRLGGPDDPLLDIIAKQFNIPKDELKWEPIMPIHDGTRLQVYHDVPFLPEDQYGWYCFCKEEEIWKSLMSMKENMQGTVPEQYRAKVRYIVKHVPPVCGLGLPFSVAWKYN